MGYRVMSYKVAGLSNQLPVSFISAAESLEGIAKDAALHEWNSRGGHEWMGDATGIFITLFSDYGDELGTCQCTITKLTPTFSCTEVEKDR
jgi:hypothetical protein